MTWALLAFSASVIGVIVTLSLLLHRQHNQTRAASDTAHEWRRQHDAKHGELELATATLGVKDEEIVLLRKRLEIAERQRNEAYGEARDHFVRRLQNSGIADVAKWGADLLATDIRTGSVLQKRSDDPKDGLLDPKL